MALNFQNNSSAPRPQVLLVVFLAVSLALVTLYSREGEDGPVHAVQNAAKVVASPFSHVGVAVGSAGDAVADSAADLTADASTLSQLKEQNEELRELVAQAEEYRQEAQRLEALLGLSDSYDIDGVAARVIGRSTEAWSQTVTIDAGEDDGIDAGQTVMGPSGVVGQVVSTTSSTATVRLLTDPQSGVAVLIQSNREEGIVRGSLDGLLYLENVDSDVSVTAGDVVVTSGLGGSYTRGLIVGTVVRVDERQGESSRRIVISPNENLGPLEEVLVVKGVGSEGAAAGANSGEEGGDAS